MMAAPSTEAEWGKKIFATLLTLPTVVVLDNVSVRLQSSALAATLTSVDITDRFLGKTKMGTPVNKCLWVGTGNNISASDDIARRIVPCRIDAGVESPHKRTGFRHRDLLAWARENRHKIVWALCVLVANWADAGQPTGRAVMGGFENWARVMGGILDAAGIGGLLANQARFLASAEDETEDIVEFVRTWLDWSDGVGKEHWTLARDFVDMPGLVHIVEIGQKDPGRVIAAYLKRYRDRIILGHKITLSTVNGSRRWYLEPESNAAAAMSRSNAKYRVNAKKR